MNELYKNLDNLVKLRKMVEGKDTKYYSHTYLRGNNVVEKGPDVSIVMTSSNRSSQVYYTLKTISASLVASKVNIVLVDDSDSDPILLEKLNEFLGSVYSIDFISINRSMKEWVNPCVNYNIGFQYIDKMCSKVVIQNGEVCHVGDVLNYVVTNVSDNEYHVFDVKGTDSLETNNKIYEMDNVREGIEIYNNPNLQWGVKDSCPEWYQIHTNPRNYHFLSCMTVNSFNNVKGFSYDYSYGIHYDDNDFLLKIRSSNINITTVNHILKNVGGIHLFHSYKEGYFNIPINYDLYNLKVKYMDNFGKYLEITDESNLNYRYNCLLNTIDTYKKEKITCILNVYKRFGNFEEQLNAVLNQSIPPKRIIIWNNNPEVNLSKFASDNIIVINSSQNLGVWPRFFSLYYLFSGEYVCVFDDDTIPRINWFKNCVETINTYNALLGTRGVIFDKGNIYESKTEFGWNGPCDSAKVVDIVGHSWFFRKEWISTIIKELPNIDENYFLCGEDTHLSYTLKKYLNIPTIVPPHPVDDTSLWGSIYETAMKYGGDKSVAVSHTPGMCNKFTNMLKYYISIGFETINNRADYIKTYSTCLDYFINLIRNKQNFAIMKCADGEFAISKNKTIRVQIADDWTFNSDSILNKHFNDSLNLMQTNVFYGVSGPTDSEEICDYWYKNIPNTHNITFANVFVNTNFEKWENFLKNADYNCVLISQVCPESRKLGGINIIDYLSIDKYLVNHWDTEYEKYFNLVSNLAKKYTNTLFFISAGPLANIFVHRMYLENPNNTYIDSGSSIDVFTKGFITRPYQYDKKLYDIPIKNLPVIYNNI